MGKIKISIDIMANEWIKHVKAVQAASGVSYKDALKMASATYRGSGLMRPSNQNQMYTQQGGNLKKSAKAQAKRLLGALGDRAVMKIAGLGLFGPQKEPEFKPATDEEYKKSGMQTAAMYGYGAVGNMLKQTAANTTAQLITSGGDRASSEMTTQGTGMSGGNLKKASKAQLIRLIGAIGDKLVDKISVGGSVNRLNKANRWQQFVDATLRDTIDTAGKATRVYYDSTSPMSQMGFGLKRHRKIKGSALLAAGY
jgi:hypothetical protein